MSVHVDPMTEWSEHQAWELAWWQGCTNTFGEEQKQLTYANRMGLVAQNIAGKWPVYDLERKSVVDIGGGPVSMLLKAVNLRLGVVVDPCHYPLWVSARYQAAHIQQVVMRGEDMPADGKMLAEAHKAPFDEAWIYNVLQHTDDPERVVANARVSARLIRLFEWVDTTPSDGHPHTLRADDLARWLGSPGTLEYLSGENGCLGFAYHGVFPS